MLEARTGSRLIVLTCMSCSQTQDDGAWTPATRLCTGVYAYQLVAGQVYPHTARRGTQAMGREHSCDSGSDSRASDWRGAGVGGPGREREGVRW